MPTVRLSMRKIREILRLRAAGKSQHLIALSVGIGQSTVGDCLTRARLAGVSWPTPLDDAALEGALYPPRPPVPSAERGEPDWAEVRLRAQTQRRDLVSVVGGVQIHPPQRIPIQLVLPTLPSLRRQTRPGHAPNPSGRGNDVRRLRRTDRPGSQSRYRGAARGPNLRRRTRRIELHVRPCILDPVTTRLD